MVENKILEIKKNNNNLVLFANHMAVLAPLKDTINGLTIAEGVA